MTNPPTSPDPLGELIAVGRTSKVYALPERRVAKVFDPGVEPDAVEDERENFDEAHALGVTPLECHGPLAVPDRLALSFDRADGGSLNAWVERNPIRVRAGGRILAREQARVHEATTSRHDDPRDLVVRYLQGPVLGGLGADIREAIAQRVRALPGGASLLHMDFHTENLFRHGSGWATIDWQTTLRGDPACDVASTMLLLRDAELWPGTPFVKRVAANVFRRQLAASYLAEYLDLTGMTRERVDAWRLPVLVLRLGGWNIESERARFLAEIKALVGR